MIDIVSPGLLAGILSPNIIFRSARVIRPASTRNYGRRNAEINTLGRVLKYLERILSFFLTVMRGLGWTPRMMTRHLVQTSTVWQHTCAAGLPQENGTSSADVVSYSTAESRQRILHMSGCQNFTYPISRDDSVVRGPATVSTRITTGSIYQHLLVSVSGIAKSLASDLHVQA